MVFAPCHLVCNWLRVLNPKQGCHYCFYGNYCYRNITVITVADFEEITVTVLIYRNFFIYRSRVLKNRNFGCHSAGLEPTTQRS